MSQENVEAIRAVYERFSEGDLSASVDLFARHVVFVPLSEFPEPEPIVGAEAVAAWTRRNLLDTWADFTLEAEEFVAMGDTVLVSVRQRGIARTSGVPTEAHYFTLWSFRGPKVIGVENFQERAEALEAAGLSE